MLVAGTVAEVTPLAELAEVAWIENFIFREKHNEYGAGVISGTAAANARGYDGSSQTVAVADTGLGDGTQAGAHTDIPARASAPSTTGPERTSRTAPRSPPTAPRTSTPATAPTPPGRSLGDGNGTGVGKGSAPGANLVFQSVEDFATLFGACGFGSGYFLLGLPDAALRPVRRGVRRTAPASTPTRGGRTSTATTPLDSATADDFMWDHPQMLVTFSAGNAGNRRQRQRGGRQRLHRRAGHRQERPHRGGLGERPAAVPAPRSADQDGTCTSTQNDIFTYGTAWPDDFPAAPVSTDRSAGNIQQMAAFSSRGPTDDGRIKPDVVAPGTWILSGYSDHVPVQLRRRDQPAERARQYDGWGVPFNINYKYMGGTSMSNPIAAGAAAVVRDYYDKAMATRPPARRW